MADQDVNDSNQRVKIVWTGDRFTQRVDFLATLKNCRGYYQCPKDVGGNRLGPLVGYAGKDETGKNFVGDKFYNCAKIETHPHVCMYCAEDVQSQIDDIDLGLTHFLAAPMGGLIFGSFLAYSVDRQYVYPEKVITALATATSREESKLSFGRHTIPAGAKVVLVEDVCNNFSTTQKVLELVQSHGAELVGIACLLNRSDLDEWEGRPVISLAHIPTEQYRQTDPAVAADVARNNVVWKPKRTEEEWESLLAAMNTIGGQ